MNNKPPLLKTIFIVWFLSVLRICKDSYAHYVDMDKFIIDYNIVDKKDLADQNPSIRERYDSYDFFLSRTVNLYKISI